MDVEPKLVDQEIDLATIKTRSLTGVVTLISRSFVVQIVATVGYLAITYFLNVPQVGLFGIVNDLVAILGYFSDIGLAASLVQKKSSPTLADLRTTFTLQQILVVTAIVIMLVLAPRLPASYGLAGPGMILLYSLLASFFLASLKTIPSVILERQLKFHILATVEVLENLIFYTVAVFMAWQGRGVESYAWAVLLRGIVGTTLIYYLATWPIGLSLSRSSLRSLLTFGLPYQFNSTIAVIKDRVLNLFMVQFIGANGVGILSWAQTWSQKPLRFIMDNVTKVTFPALSRMQDHPGELKKGIEKTLFFITLITFPILAGMAMLTSKVLQLVPEYSKWQVALLPLVLYCFNSALASVSTPLTNTLNALGKVKTNTYLMVMWTVLAWSLMPLFAKFFGYEGVAYATALIALTSIIPVILVKRLVDFSLTNSILKPTLATLVMMLVTWLISINLPNSFHSLVLTIGISMIVYVACIFALVGQSLMLDVQKFAHAFRSKK